VRSQRLPWVCVLRYLWRVVLGRVFFFFSSRRRHTRSTRDWSSDVCSSDLHLRSVRRTTGRRVDHLGRLAEILRTDRSWRDHAKRSEERRVGKGVEAGGSHTSRTKQAGIARRENPLEN